MFVYAVTAVTERVTLSELVPNLSRQLTARLGLSCRIVASLYYFCQFLSSKSCQCSGNHKFRTETDRHTITKTTINLKICSSASFCLPNDVETKYTFVFNASLLIGYVKFELHINAKVSFPFNGIDPAVCRSTAAYIFIGVRAGGERGATAHPAE